MKCEFTTIVGTCEVLVVDADNAVGKLVQDSLPAGRVRTALSVDQAQAEMTHRPADLVLVNLQINDNGGAGLIKALRAKHPGCEIIAVSRSKRSDACLEAWRAGAGDILHTPLQAEELKVSVAAAWRRQGEARQRGGRNRRLRAVCKQLNKARHEIRQQVDLLCNDLVRAYQEMAHQLNTTQLTVDYCQMVSNEIEVEGLLRRTMEWVLSKVGPVNAAVYLADADHRFSLGAYLNLDTEADAVLIGAMGETVIAQCSRSAHCVTLETDGQIEELFGLAGTALKGRSWMSAACRAPAPKSECLAVLVVFRKQGEPLDPVRSMLEAIAPILGERIEQALELYHRLHPEGEHDDGAELDGAE